MHTLVIFGASGDLTQRKLMPALYRLAEKKRLPQPIRIVGVSRTPYSHDAWRTELRESTAKAVEDESKGKSKLDEQVWQEFAASVFYHPADATKRDSLAGLAEYLKQLEGGAAADRVYYLATAPQLYEAVVTSLGAAEMTKEGHGARRVVIEKPFGSDLPSAERLNETVHRVFAERQVFRIDHYLGKETVQNIAVLRFANAIFEPIWNRRYIEHVEITVAEEVDVGGRGEYYDTAGVLRDIFQNHLLQLLAITAMEPPIRFEADAVRDEKVKVLRAIRRMTPEDVARDTLRGQYDGYRREENVRPESRTATFAAARFLVENWRWQGVPFFLRSGKGMSCRTTQIVVDFQEPPYCMFGQDAAGCHEANRLVIQVQPAEGIQLHFQTKVPDSEMALRRTELDFKFERAFAGQAMPDAYQRLLLDALEGDASLFLRADEVQEAWSIIDPIQQAWDKGDHPRLFAYQKGFWGPHESTDWIRGHGREWFDTCPILT
jgi:glucose-6-phosphate 1-dehydrogenase